MTLRSLLVFWLLIGTTGLTRADAPAPLFGPDPLGGYHLVAEDGKARQTTQTVEGPFFTQAARIAVSEKPAGFNGANFSRVTTAPVHKGDALAYGFWARSLTGAGHVQLYVAPNAPPYQAISTTEFTPTESWRFFHVTFTAPTDAPSGGLLFNLFLHFQAQTVEIGGLTAWDLGPNATGEEIARALLPPGYHEDFEGAWIPAGQNHGAPPVSIAPDSKAQITGVLPARWTEDSRWGADVAVDYTKTTGDGSPTGLRIRAARITSGIALLRWDGIRLNAGLPMRLRVRLRSSTGSDIRLGIRSATRYTDYWRATAHAAPEWRRFEWVIPPTVDDPQAQFAFTFERPAEIDVDDFDLSYLSPDAGQSLTGNLLPNSAFPDGLPRPWAVSNDTPAARYEPDPATPGPTGLPSLKVTPQPTGQIRAQMEAPFTGQEGGEHTFSLSLKGSRAGQILLLRFGPPSQPLYAAPFEQPVTLTTDWRRYEFTVKMPVTADGFYLARLTSVSPEPFWTDGWQVEAAPKAGPLQRAGGPAEVALFPVRNMGVSFAGRPLPLRVTVLGAIPAGAILKGTLTDLSDKRIPLGPYPLTTASLQRQTLALRPRGVSPLGSYVVELGVYDAHGQALSRSAEALLHRIRPPRNPQGFEPDSPFGLHIIPVPEQAQMAQDLGFKWARVFGFYGWNAVQPEAGRWDWTASEHLTRLYRDHRLMILGVLGDPPRSATVAPPDFQGWQDHAAAPRPDQYPAWAEYARTVAARFRGRVAAWELWNEPDWPEFYWQGWKGGVFEHGTPERFVAQSRVEAAAIRAGDPKARVFWNIASAVTNKDWNAQVAAGGVFGLVDSVSFHQYVSTGIGFPGDALSQSVDLVKGWRERDARDKAMPIWDTEGGQSGEVMNLYRHTPPVGWRERAPYWGDYLVRYYVSLLSQGVDKFFLYNFYNGSWTPSYEMLNADGAMHSNGVALSNLIWHLDGTKFRRIVALAPGVNAYLFDGGTPRRAVAVVLAQDLGRVTLPALLKGVQLHDLWGNDLRLPAALGGQAAFALGDGLTADQLAARLAAGIRHVNAGIGR